MTFMNQEWQVLCGIRQNFDTFSCHNLEKIVILHTNNNKKRGLAYNGRQKIDL